MLRKLFVSLKLVGLVALAAGCTPSAEVAGEEADVVTPAGLSGYYEPSNPRLTPTGKRFAPYTGIAVRGGLAYLGDGSNVDVVDLRLTKITKTFRVPAQTLSFDSVTTVSGIPGDAGSGGNGLGDSLVACGFLAAGPTWTYSVTWLNPATGGLRKEVWLQMDTYLAKHRRVPKMECRLSGQRVFVSLTFGDPRLPSEIVAFAQPEDVVSSFAYESIPNATRTPLPDWEAWGINFAPLNSVDFAIASRSTIERTTAGGAQPLREARAGENFVDVWKVNEETLLAVDNNGALLTLSPKSGAELSRKAVTTRSLTSVWVENKTAFVLASGQGYFVYPLPQ